MSWQQLVFASNREQAATLEDALLELGALSVTLQDNADEPVLEPGVGERPLWQATRLVALYDADADIDAVIAQLSSEFDTLPQWQIEQVADQAWERAWMDSFQPMRFGQRLWVCPSWAQAPDPEAIVLALDPGLAFGTGTHPTTALCLTWLDGLNLAGCDVLDYGCGSGILAIAALLLGAERAVAVDNDPQALIATRDNAERNGIAAERLLTFTPEQLPSELRFAVTVANILAGPLQTLAPLLTEKTSVGGKLAISGILSEQAEAVAACYRDAFTLQAPTLLQESDSAQQWARIDGVKAR
ncbi:MAG: prmA [Verrucomicrobiaceae bacterium]|nr:prmA [Verrucomicrobiaceae bacterium]